MNDALIIRKHCQKVVANLVQSLDVPVELFLPSLSNAISLFPHLELGLEISKALIDELFVADACHAIRRLHEVIKLFLQRVEVKLDVPWASRAVAS